MPKLFLLCGLPGSGKTTLAKELEISHQALRLCPDEWVSSLLASQEDIAEHARLRPLVDTLQWKVAKRTLQLGVNVVLENGFWFREERDLYRTVAKNIDADVELIYLDFSRDELWKRLSARNQNLPPDTFTVSEKELDQWINQFEPPTQEELGKMP